MNTTRPLAIAVDAKEKAQAKTTAAMTKGDLEAAINAMTEWAAAHGQVMVLQSIDHMTKEDHGQDRILNCLLDLALRTDDVWSGRGNDLRRAYRDGCTEAIAKYRLSLRIIK